MSRKILVVLLVAAFSLGMPTLGNSGGMGKEGKGAGSALDKETLRGTVTRVDGNAVTLRDAECRERTVEAANLRELKDIRIGDHVAVRDGRFAEAVSDPLAGYGISSLPFPGEKC